MKYHRADLHFQLGLHCLRQPPSLAFQYSYFPRNFESVGRYKHRERSNFVPLRIQPISLDETAQLTTDENFPGALRNWRAERRNLASSAADPIDPPAAGGTRTACERIVVFSKRDLVPEWGIEV